MLRAAVAAAQPSPTAPSSDPDLELRELKAAATPPAPPRPVPGQKRSKEQADADRKAQSDALVAAAEKAKDFQQKYPEHPGAAEARKIETVSLLRAVRTGTAALENQAKRSAEAFLADERNSRRDRYHVASMLKQWAVQKKDIKDEAVLFSEYEKNAAELFAEYADVPDVYQIFLGLARHAPEPKARKLAADLLQSPAPDAVKQAAQAVLDRLDLVGKPIDLKFIVTNGTVFELARHKGKPVVIYFWASFSPGSLAALPAIRAAAADHPEALFIGVNLDSDWSIAQAALGGQPAPGLQRWEPQGFRGSVPRQLHLERVPQACVVDAQGLVRGLADPSQLGALLAASK